MNQDWNTLYNTFKGPDWPECPPQEEFYTLPEWIQKELIEVFKVDPYSNNLLPHKQFVCRGEKPITVFYTLDTDGGGSWFGSDYITTIKRKYGDKKFSKVFEWCSGPGFIGFSLLSHNICDRLCFNDLHNPAIELINLTTNYKDNQCSDLVSAYLLKDLRLLPSFEMFDLVVSNPPHFNKNVSLLSYGNRLGTDINWGSHRHFFKNIKSHLVKDGIILLQENRQGSTVKDFEDMIIESDLKVTDCFDSTTNPDLYYIEIKVNN